MATVGSTAGGYVKGVENTMFSKWNKGLIDRFKEKLVPANKSSREKIENRDEPHEAYVKEFWNRTYSPFGVTYPQDIPDDTFTQDQPALNNEIIDKNIAIVTEFYKYCQFVIQENHPKYASPTNGFIPISLNVTFDGLSGIKIYNAINADTRFLPPNYPDALKFIIKGVNHKISQNGWDTTIDTVVIANNVDKNGVPILPYGDLKKEVKTLIYKGSLGSLDEGIGSIVRQVYNNPPGKGSGAAGEISSCKEMPSKGSSSKIIKASDNTNTKAIGYVINKLEGGYFHPLHARNSKGELKSSFDYRTTKNPTTGNSGETLWGIDRPNGAHEQSKDKKIQTAGIKFWNEVDKLSGFGIYKTQNQTIKKYDWNTKKQPQLKGTWGWLYNPGFTDGSILADNAKIIITEGFEKNMNSKDIGFGGHPLYNIVKSDGRLLFMYYRAWWNGPGWFKKFARNLKSKYDSGVTNIDQLICADLTFRYNIYSPNYWRDGIIKMKNLIDFNENT
jgi:hypothetical protein